MDFWALKVPSGKRLTVKVKKGAQLYFTQASIDCRDEMVALLVHQKSLSDFVVGAFLSNIPQLVYTPSILFTEDFQISHNGSNCIVTVCGYRVPPFRNFISTRPAVGTTCGTCIDWGLNETDGIHKVKISSKPYPLSFGRPFLFEVNEDEEVHLIGARIVNMAACQDKMVALLLHQEDNIDRVAGAFLHSLPEQVYYPPHVFYKDFQISHTGSLGGYLVEFVAEKFKYTTVELPSGRTSESNTSVELPSGRTSESNTSVELPLPSGEGCSSNTYPHKKPKIEG